MTMRLIQAQPHEGKWCVANVRIGLLISAGQGYSVYWSSLMQTTGQDQCKWVVKSLQLRNPALGLNHEAGRGDYRIMYFVTVSEKIDD